MCIGQELELDKLSQAGRMQLVNFMQELDVADMTSLTAFRVMVLAVQSNGTRAVSLRSARIIKDKAWAEPGRRPVLDCIDYTVHLKRIHLSTAIW